MARGRRASPGSMPPLQSWSHGDGQNTVVVFVYDGVSSTDVIVVADALAEPLSATVHLVAAQPGRVVAIEPARTIEAADLQSVSTPMGLVIPGGLAWKREVENPAVMRWLSDTAATSRGVVAVSTGSLLLAATGMLDGCEATGHWLANDLMTDLGATPSFTRVVSDRRIVTASGARAATEAAKELALEMLYGRT